MSERTRTKLGCEYLSEVWDLHYKVNLYMSDTLYELDKICIRN